MVYSSLLFIYGFLPISLLLFYVTPKKMRELMLLILSMVFCGMMSLYFLIFMILYTAVNFGFAHIIGKVRKNEKLVALPLACGIILDLMAILVFRTRYFNWLQGIMKVPEGFFPVGISFFTLAAIGTLIDIYKGRVAADRNFIRFALYIMFFPRLIMGPLLRYSVFTKILDRRNESLSEIGKGMNIFIKGLAKKVIAADSLLMLYNAAHYVEVREMSALTAWLGVTAYLLCFYYTLSGFADMGNGIAYCFGLKFPQSFNYPILSTRIKHFAARWQSQVIQWLRRYVTKPVYNVCKKRWMKEMVFVCGWTLFGFWYTVALNGVLWGLLIGLAVIIEGRMLKKDPLDITGIIYTFIVVIVCTVFLSGDGIGYSVKYLIAMTGFNGSFADSQSFYLLKSYIVLLLITMYGATDLFRNMMMRTKRKKVKMIVNIVTPAVVIITLAVCTALMSYSGSSDMILLKL
jgi:alginate O-acetyltransferase complex protein AlgI